LSRQTPMSGENKLLEEILQELRTTNRLLHTMHEDLQALTRRLVPGARGGERIEKGGPMAEITVNTPEKLQEWMAIFERRGMRVEFYEYPGRGRDYFAKIWGYLGNRKSGGED